MFKNNICSIIDAVSKNLQEVFVLAYHLKKYDVQMKTNNCKIILISDEFASKVPIIVKKIIQSNHYSPNKNSFIVREGVKFNLLVGTNYSNKLSIEDSNDSTIDPFVTAINPNQEVSDQKFVNVLFSMVREKNTKGINDFQFILTQYGLNIVANDRTLIKKNWITANDF